MGATSGRVRCKPENRRRTCRSGLARDEASTSAHKNHHFSDHRNTAYCSEDATCWRSWAATSAQDCPHHSWRPAPRNCRFATAPYNCRHTYATICSMFGLNPAFYRPTAGSQRANAAVDTCPLAQLKLRLERAGKTQDWYQTGIS